MNIPTIMAFVSLIEGPYKLPILIGVVIILALFFTRFVFKTVKWILLLTAVGILGALLIKFLIGVGQ